MASFTKAVDWVENESEVVDLDGDSFLVALSNTAPASETNPPLANGNGVLANVTQISYTNLSSRALTRSASVETAGVYKLDFDDLVLTATAGSVGPFRYIYVVDDTPSSPADPIIGVYDLVTPVTIGDGGSRTLQFHADGFLTKT